MPPTQAAPAADETQAAIARLEARVERIERAVLRMADAMDQLQPLAAMAADAADEEAMKLMDRGVDVDGRVRKLVRVSETLTRPEVLDRLEAAAAQAVALEDTVGMLGDMLDGFADRLAARTGVDTDQRVDAVVSVLTRMTEPRTLGTMERMLDQLDMAEGTFGMALDIFDDLVARWHAEGQDPEQRIQSLVTLADRLTSPNAVRLAHKVLDKSENLEQLMDVALVAPDTLGMVMDIMDEFMREAENRGLELDLLLDRTVQVAIRAGRLVGSDELQELIDSAVLDPGAVSVVSQAANALAETRAEPAGKTGMFGALGALSDPEIQTALNFAIRFGRRFGKTVSSDTTKLTTRS